MQLAIMNSMYLLAIQEQEGRGWTVGSKEQKKNTSNHTLLIFIGNFTDPGKAVSNTATLPLIIIIFIMFYWFFSVASERTTRMWT